MAKIPINVKTGDIAQQEVIVGIDLGTTNSLVAYIKNGEPIIATDNSGKRTLVPSVIHFSDDGGLVVGDAAKARVVTHPTTTIYSVKRLLGKSYSDMSELAGSLGYRIIDQDEDRLVKIEVKGKFYTPVELSAEILKYLKSRIETQLGMAVSKVVITVPAYFNDAQRQATRDAGKLAGLEVLRIVNEPTAAALAYGKHAKVEAETVVVYDLGGGTFDVSVLRLQGGIYDVLSTNGDTALGGDDIDAAIVAHWIKEKGLNPSALVKDKQLAQTIRVKAEAAKKQLSSQNEYSSAGFELTRADFEKLIKPLIETTMSKTELALQDAELEPDEIDKVILVGGSTRIPMIKQELLDLLKKPVYDDIDPDEVVAIGAAIQADILSGNGGDTLLLDVTPLSLGIETVGGLMDTILPRNSKVPSSVGRSYTTSVDGQKNLKVAVFQGERELVEHNRKLGEFVLKDIPPMPAGIPKLQIQFVLDADGILKVKAMEERSGTETEVELRSQYGISEEEMGRMLLDSIKNAESDMKVKQLIDARTEANSLILSATKFVEQNREILSSQEVELIQGMKTGLVTAVASTDKDDILAQIQQLNDLTAPLAERAMDHTIKQALKGTKLG